ncbi:DMT family transporter [Ottowia sp.]|uniref:DMT family transporter n=1 Tax=Ottowia sp. TaxID=1898956 RepID=UPI0025D284FA|nr:DMT family transporter [Ottowia sp.]MBK6612831.1 DMT family transporter [Ottowia sp.]MBK6748041.1 DMT family transporter [Ottowia sp.]
MTAWSHARAAWTMVLVTLLWSTAGVVTRQLTHAQGFEVTFWRSLFTVLALLAILPAWQGLGVFARLPWRRRAFWLAGLCWAVMFTAFMVALTLTGVARVLVTMAVGPLLTALLSRLVTGRRLPRRTWAAIGVAGAGMAWMFTGQLGAAQGTDAWLGSIVVLGVPVAAATQWTIAQRSQAQGEPVDLVPAVLLGAVISTLAMGPLAWPFAASGRDLAWLAALGVGQLAVPCVLAVLCARVLPAAEVSLLSLLEVVFGIALVWVIAGEAPRPEVLAGGTLVVGALLANELMGWAGQRGTAGIGPA